MAEASGLVRLARSRRRSRDFFARSQDDDPQEYPSSTMAKPDDLSNLIADLQRQRQSLEADLDETARSQKSTAKIVEKIIEIKQRAEEIRQRTLAPSDPQ